MSATAQPASTTTSAAAKPRRVALLTSTRTRTLGLLAGLALLVVLMGLSLAIGSLRIPLADVIDAFTDRQDTDEHTIVRELRVPRTLLGLLVGVGLGASGALMQGLTRNPLAEPGILGINAGASLAVVLAILVLDITTPSAYVWFALAGAGLTWVAVYALGTSGRQGASPTTLALAGAVMAALLVALTSAILTFDTQTLAQFRYWNVGSIAGRQTEVVWTIAPFIVVGFALALLAGRWLNALALGDDVAKALGQRIGLVRAGVAVAFILLAGAAVAAAGPILFVGLAVPHMARALVGTDYRWIVPFSGVIGACFLLAGDVLGRVLTSPAELEVGVVTAALGAPFFIWLVRRRNLPQL
ncbi:MAG TPA: iron ABC transporter permease [Solirubrobacteraceae bacterium]|nr:iron ABC transporter permease [Solirubrobacteraceae bacterium]